MLRQLLFLSCICSLPLLSGCSLLGLAAYKMSGPEKHPVAFALPKEPTIVIVDRPVNFGEVALDAQRIGSNITDRLKASKTVTATLLDPGLAVDRRSRPTADDRRLQPTQLAADCGAKQMIYVEILHYDSSPSIGGDAAEGRIDASVWVVDVATGQVRWPPEANQGFPVTASVPFTPLANRVSEESIRAQLDAKLAEKVAQLFTGWTEE
jgi:hypothetical protein